MCQFWIDLFNEREENKRIIAENERLLINGVLTVMQIQSCDAEQAMNYLGYTGEGRLRVRKLLEQAGVPVGASA